MSVILITGKPGSGKSLSLVKRWLLRNIAKIDTPNERLIYTNIAGLSNLFLSLAVNKQYGNPDKILTPDMVEKIFVKVPPPTDKTYNQVIMTMPSYALLIVDEAQKYWNNRAYASTANQEILAYFQEHRRRGHDVILATQHFEQVDIGIRRLCEAHYRLERMKKIGFASAIKVLIYEQGETIECKHDGRETWRIDKSVFRCYKSYEGGAESEIVRKPPNIFFANYKLTVLFIIILAVFVKCSFFRSPKPSPVPVVSSSSSSFDIGVYEDYFCSPEALFVLRSGGLVDTIPKRGVPISLCPYVNYQHGGVK
jgi:zona occludens toxin (predicted ATPase)